MKQERYCKEESCGALLKTPRALRCKACALKIAKKGYIYRMPTGRGSGWRL